MALKDLVVDQNALEEELIEKIISPYVRYDQQQKNVLMVEDDTKRVDLLKKIVIYLFALKGWKYIGGGEEVQQEASPKKISEVLSINGSTVRNALQTMRKQGYIYKTQSGGYTIQPQAIFKIKKMLNIN